MINLFLALHSRMRMIGDRRFPQRREGLRPAVRRGCCVIFAGTSSALAALSVRGRRRGVQRAVLDGVSTVSVGPAQRARVGPQHRTGHIAKRVLKQTEGKRMSEKSRRRHYFEYLHLQ